MFLDHSLKQPAKKELSNKALKAVLVNITSADFSIRFSALGVETLAGYVRDNLGETCQIKIIDSQLLASRDEIVEEILSFSPDVIGFSANPGSIEEMDAIIERVRGGEGEPSLLVFGNVVATFLAERFLEKYPESLVVVGEGEEAFTQILRSFHCRLNLETIPNLAYKNSHGRIIFTPKKRMALKEIGLPAFDNIENYIARDFRIGAETSRGCYHNCTFCNRRKFLSGNLYQKYPVERVIRLIVELSSKNVLGINFVDDDFLQGSEETLTGIAQGIIEGKKEGRINSQFRFFFSTRADNIISRKYILKKFVEAGLTGVFLGIESFDEKTLIRFCKKISYSEIKSSLSILKSLNLSVEIGIIMFDPQMTLQQLENNVSRIKMAKVEQYLSYPFNQLRVQAGSPIVKTLKRLKLINDEMNYDWIVFPYSFQSKEVFSVVSVCKEWEMDSYRVADSLKNLYRYHSFTSDVGSEQAELVTDYLGRMRKIYIDFLDEVIGAVKEDKTSESSFEELKKHFCKLRTVLITRILSDIERNLLKDTFNDLYKNGAIALVKSYCFLKKDCERLKLSSIPLFYSLSPNRMAPFLNEFALQQEESGFDLRLSKEDIFRVQDLVGASVFGNHEK